MLKEILKKEEFEAMPEVVRDHYKDVNGEYHLTLVDKSRLDEFRDNNIRLKKDREDLEKTISKYKNIDPVKAQEALDKLKKIEEKELLEKGEVEQVLQTRTAAMKTEYETKLEAEQRRVNELNARLSTVLIDNALTSVCLGKEIGVRPNAAPVVVMMARSVWRLDKDGKPVAMDGENVIYGKDGKPLSMQEWVAGLKKDHDYLFAQPVGGGSNGGDGGAPDLHRSKMTRAQKIEFIDKNGNEKYMQLPE